MEFFMKSSIFKRTAIVAALAAIGSVAHAADWSDTALSERYGQNFCEPYNGCGIGKHILNLTNVSGYAYGTNFISIDLLTSDAKDPAINTGSTTLPATASKSAVGAQEAYAAYRNTVDFSKFTASPLSYAGVIRSVGATAGFDWNTKNDAYQSKKQMAVVGPTVMFNVPGFLNISVLELYESNYPITTTATSRYTYKPHAELDAAFGIPVNIGPAKFSIEGYWDYIGEKGPLEPTTYGNDKSGRENHFDGRIMYDVSGLIGSKAKTFQLGFEYEFWKNKFGNLVSDAGAGARASTPMVRGEYHF
jgi:hypothetical protein